jgi:flagellar basal body-associated protein FliL
MAEENEIVEEPKAAGGILPMVIVGILTLVLGLAAGYFLSDNSVADGDEAGEETTEAATPEGTVRMDDADTVVVPFEDFSINLKDSSSMRILNMSITIECDSTVEQKVAKKSPQIRHAILTFTSEYTVSSLSGLEGKMDLRDEIQLRINAIIKPHRVERVYFTKFIIGK